STAVFLQALCGVAAGCTKTSITSHFALRANMADISAKENAQETAVNVCGMVSHFFSTPVEAHPA
ncbi:unnamed protein product, partial [Hapterophycus canaliculatus]